MESQDWWRNSAIYQIYPRSFKDSNGDGEGDIQGVISRLDYLEWLGIDAIWLSPFYKSPNKDGGYDVADPRAVDPRFGKLEDVIELIKKSHERKIRVIVDIVPNHFSTEHIWFKDAIKSPPGSTARSRFHFYSGRGEKGEIPPNNWNSIFGGPAWTRLVSDSGEPEQWYLHLFDSTQADLNWDNSEVRDDFVKTLKFWLDLGVDGFRIDVAHGLAKEEISKDHRDPEGLTRALRLDVTNMASDERESLLSDVPFFDREGVHDIYREWRKILNSYGEDRITVAEAWVHPSSRAARYVRPDELHQIFNFDFLIAPWNSRTLIPAIKRTLEEVSVVQAPPTWVLSNHDSPRLVTRLGGGLIGERRARAFALLTHALPGGIYIFQGEELGLSDGDIPDSARQDPVYFRSNGSDKGRDGARVPLPWHEGKNFGFSNGTPWLPMSEELANRTVSKQQSETSSTLNLYRQSLSIRKTHIALQKSNDYNLLWIDMPDGLIGFSRGKNFYLFANTNAETVTLEVPSGLKLLLASGEGVTLKKETLQIPGDVTCWLTA